jgi:broad specificity phosphatase PhoE
VLPEVTDFCRLVLLRHPELHQAHANTAVGGGKAELSRRGKERVLAWIALLKSTAIDLVVAADQPQASQPAAAFARDRGLEVGHEPRLRDQDMGEWQGRSWNELIEVDQARVRQFFEHFAETVPPRGESLGQAVERVLAWWKEIYPEGAGKTVAVVAAGSLLSGFTAAMLGMRLSRCLSLALPHGGIGVVDVFANGVRLTAWNLDALDR